MRELGWRTGRVPRASVPKEEVARLMREADLFVLPSLAETFGAC